MEKFFIVRIKLNEGITVWGRYDEAYKEALNNGALYTSKYYAIRDARRDQTDDILYICASWEDPPRGVNVVTQSHERQTYQHGKPI